MIIRSIVGTSWFTCTVILPRGEEFISPLPPNTVKLTDGPVYADNATKYCILVRAKDELGAHLILQSLVRYL